jgi:hypothetical protein
MIKRTKRFLCPALFLSLVFLFGATIILHDYLCHEHLHEIYSPLHSYYNNPPAFEAGAFFGRLPETNILIVPNEKIHLYEFIKNIFHPPDFQS